MGMTAYIDGACHGSNPGRASSAYVVYDSHLREIATKAVAHARPETNNFAEYMALLILLRKAKKMGWKDMTIYSDSRLVVMQCTESWSVSSKFADFAALASDLLWKGRHKLIHMKGHGRDPRKGLHRGNDRADALCDLILDDVLRKK